MRHISGRLCGGLGLVLGLLAVFPLNAAETNTPAGLTAEGLIQQIETHQPLRIHRLKELRFGDLDARAMTISRDGKRVFAFQVGGQPLYLFMWDNEKEEVLWRLPDNQIDYSNAVAISDDLALVAFGRNSGAVDLHDGQTGKLLKSYDQLKNWVETVGFSPDGKSVYAVDHRGYSMVASLDQTSAVVEEGKADAKYNLPSAMFAANEGHWCRLVHFQDERSITLALGNSERIRLPLETEKKISNHSTMAALESGFVIGQQSDLHFVRVDWTNKANPVSYEMVSLGDLSVRKIEIGDDQNTVWVTDLRELLFFDYSTGERINRLRLPPNEGYGETALLPKADLILASSGNGFRKEPIVSSFWQIKGDKQTRETLIKSAVHQWLAEQRWDAIEAIARHWDGRTDILFNEEQETVGTRLVRWVAEYQYPGKSDKERNAIYEAWIEKNPDDAMLLRLAMFEIYRELAFQSVPRTSSRYVDASQQEQYDRHALKAWSFVQPLFQRTQTPADAYVSAVRAARLLRWEEGELEEYLTRGKRDWPKYYPIDNQRISDRLSDPREEPLAAVGSIADTTADALGGEAGDILYARLYTQLARLDPLKSKGGLFPLDKQRVQRGYRLLAEQAEDAPLINFGLMYVAQERSHDTALAMLRAMLEAGIMPEFVPDNFQEEEDENSFLLAVWKEMVKSAGQEE